MRVRSQFEVVRSYDIGVPRQPVCSKSAHGGTLVGSSCTSPLKRAVRRTQPTRRPQRPRAMAVLIGMTMRAHRTTGLHVLPVLMVLAAAAAAIDAPQPAHAAEFAPCDVDACECAGVSLASLRGTVVPELKFAGQRYQLAICEPVRAQPECSAASPDGDASTVLANASFLLHNAHGGCAALGDVQSMEAAVALRSGGSRALVARYQRGNTSVTIEFSAGTRSRPTNLTETARGHWSLRWKVLQADQLLSIQVGALRDPLQSEVDRVSTSPTCPASRPGVLAAFRDPQNETCVPLYAQFMSEQATCDLMPTFSRNQDHMMYNIIKLLLQFVLFVLSLGSLIWKKHIEDRHLQVSTSTVKRFPHVGCMPFVLSVSCSRLCAVSNQHSDFRNTRSRTLDATSKSST